jgi:hypothetical protein
MPQTARPAKMPVCCARAHSKVTMHEANLARNARTAQRAKEKGTLNQRHFDAIDRAKADVAEAKRLLVEHEASHAGRP